MCGLMVVLVRVVVWCLVVSLGLFGAFLWCCLLCSCVERLCVVVLVCVVGVGAAVASVLGFCYC